MSKRILLACAGGFSTSMLVEKMKEEVKKRGEDVFIDACSESKITENLPADIIMLGPQMGHIEDEVKDLVNNEVPVTTIDMADYGMMNGEKVLDVALELINNG
ncbi:PTS sugar transporter subunit IIB [Amphibacillus cookii]|uniref:PTS sugar transporter subunit IIB n=1 Tax=Amphibacillus cookii TaxID=767787 RepID=UPI00195DE372|nr:PTS sugar transporter subunit IIB [Amphibacillus cookii]MBM7539947.1 PTS system cellobiose-specific IIB component [Amphibacillus cookii]